MKQAFLGLGLFLVACGGAQQVASDKVPQITPKKNFYMRATLDNDPSSYLGRFISDSLSVDEIDEVSAEKNECSKFFEIKKIDGAGINYDEYYQASTQAAAGLQAQIKAVQAGANYASDKVVRVKYAQGEKWTAEITDPAALRACCDEIGCPSRYIAEFVSGKGSIYHLDSKNADAGLSVKKVAGVDVKDGIKWEQSVDFSSSPIFFAFRVGTTTGDSSMSASSNIPEDGWCENLPQRRDGQYFCGVSRWMDEESTARDQAIFDARVQVLRYIGEELKINSSILRTTDGSSSNQVENTEMKRATEGVASFVKAERFKTEEDQQPGRRLYRVKALTFIKNADLKAASKALK